MMTSEADNNKLNFSFAGCGFLGIYNFGVAACLKRYVPHLLNKVSGASAGALTGCFILTDIPIRISTELWIETCVTTRNKVIGAMSPSSDIVGMVRRYLEAHIPSDIHLIVNGKIYVSMTRVRDMKNVVISHFETRAEFIDALICSMTIPFFSGLIPPLFRGERYIDGGFSTNIIIHDEHTITVSPYSGEADICPRDGPMLSPWVVMMPNNTSLEISKKNVVRMSRTIIPPGPETLSEIWHQGYADALRFLQGRGLVTCQTCLSHRSLLQSSYRDNSKIKQMEDSTEPPRSISPQDIEWELVNESQSEVIDTTDQECCPECIDIREGNMPEVIQEIFREAISVDLQNTGLRAKLKEYKIIKLFSLTTLPLALTYDLVYATVLKLTQLPASLLSQVSMPTSTTESPMVTSGQESVLGHYLKLPNFWE